MTRTFSEIMKDFSDNIGEIEVVAKEILATLDEYSTKDPKILVLYHADLDGCASAFGIERLLDGYIISLVLNKGSWPVVKPAYRRINYNYSLDSIEEIKEANIIFIVDYSLSNKDHIEYFLNNATDAKIVWIDHHATSLSILEKKTDHAKRFMDNKNLIHYIHSEKGCSAALLCHLMAKTVFDCAMEVTYNDYFVSEGRKKDIQSPPEIIKQISLYDTFHPEASREFYYSINTIEYDIERLTLNNNEPFSLWFSLLDRIVSPDGDPTYVYNWVTNGIINPPTLEHFNACCSYNLEKIMVAGATIMNYEIQSNKIGKTGAMFDIIVELDGKEYTCAVLNTKGNSYRFEETYYEKDCVILFYFNKYASYTYSVFADENNPNKIPPNCRFIAELHGGGGHTGDAGFTINHNIFENIMRSNDEWPYIVSDENHTVRIRKA